MKKMLKLLLLICISFTCVQSVYAAGIACNNRLTEGQNIAYRLSSEVEYTVSIPNAVYKLMYPSGMSNRLVLNPTNDYMTSKMDFYQYRRSDYANAYTYVFRKNSSGNYYNCTDQMNIYDWVYGEIRINDYSMNNYSNATREAVILHEMLHVYGLDDIDNANSIMYRFTPNVTYLTADANAVLNNKY